MIVPEIKVGDEVALVERDMRFVCKLLIVRETPARWISYAGKQFRKSDGSVVPRYLDSRRRIVSIEAYEFARRIP